MSYELVCRILDDVQQQGLVAALNYTEQFDHIRLTADQAVWNPLTLPPARLDPAVARAIDFAAENIRQFHVATRPADIRVQPAPGLTVTERFVPFRRVGVYVPNGKYPLVSSLLMTAIPAQVAGVDNLVVAIAPRGAIWDHPVWVYALQKLHITTVLNLGGAQAIACLGYGFPGFDPVDFIAGPGNRYVAWAKQELLRRGVAGIDVVAGPSEVLVISSDPQDAPVVAMDLLAQAEHDPDAQAMCVSWNPQVIDAVKAIVTAQPQPDTLGHIEYRLVADPNAAVALANAVAPEHLGLMGADAEALKDQLLTAGAIFVGRLAGQALGDYVAGPSHVLPTGGSGRFLSGISTRTFMRRISVIETTPELPTEYLQFGEQLARLEGLHFHERSLAVRESLAKEDA